MKKLKLAIILLIISNLIFAQQKGHHLTVSGGLGFTKFKYELKGINQFSGLGRNNGKLGGLGSLGYSYFFSRNWGVSTGVGLSYYSTIGRYNSPFYKNQYLSLGNHTVEDVVPGTLGEYELRVRLSNWKEKQIGWFLEIPLTINFQHKFGKSQKVGIYAGAGAKFQLPIKTTYKVVDKANKNEGGLNISGYFDYPENNDIGAADNRTGELPQIDGHGFGIVYNPNERLGWNGKSDLKFGFALTGELGLLIELSRRIDLTLGGYIDYGFRDIKNTTKILIASNGNYHPDANDNLGAGIDYNGILNSDKVNSVNLLSYGAKIGLKIKLGKLQIPESIEEEFVKEKTVQDTFTDPNEDAAKSLENIENLIKDLINKEIETRISEVKTVDTVYITVEKEDHGLTSEEKAVLEANIYFDFAKYAIRGSDVELLNKKAEILNAHPEIRLRILGNTCDIDGDRVNIPLGLNRATSAKNHLVKKGINPERIVIATQSSYVPIAPNSSADNRKLNRRCDFDIISK